MSKLAATNIVHFKNLNKDQLEAIYQISEHLNKSSATESLINDALDWAVEIVSAERGLFVKCVDGDKEFEIVAARNVNKENISDLSGFSSGILHKVITERKAQLFHDAQSDPQVSKFNSIQIQQIKSVIGVPIIQNDEPWGVILVDSVINRKSFTKENLIFLNFFANLVSLSLDKILNIEILLKEKLLLENELENLQPVPTMIGNSKVMQNLFKLIHKVAKTDATVLILGESGTGKDLVARAIHELSNRKSNPFLAQFCGSIPDNLLESELFGYKKGAFTGANSDKKGLLEVANNGTFFLDEIADISNPLQAKLLRVLENKEIIPLGDTQVRKINVRILAATNKELKKLVDEEKFREDLYYRLNVFPIKVPPLRDRGSDILLLANYFIKEISPEKINISSDAVKKIMDYDWPGNVRQLYNVIQRALILVDENKITSEHIIWDDDPKEAKFTGTLKEVEVRLLKERLNKYDGNRTLAAKSLGVSVRWVQLKIKEYELEQ
ncbi:MAG: sigma-54-dependent Fis family transcriptional regulator [Ignavibacteriae bacterium HGW-Ignavibacteriae-2]|jgi:Nif-specific regulatory protein|nr:MAG: sigma-54-dependent Fis family transcriptional regulator [Ignavibacteriae bacterium HGW-Ignavibacteriae-2]